MLITVLSVLALVALASPIWVPAWAILRRTTRPGLACVIIFVLWTAFLQVTFGLDNLRTDLGWTIPLWPF